MLNFESFHEIVKDFEITIYKDDGVYRHIRVGKPGSTPYSWHIVTWPGSLSFSGDMGDFTFERLNDMFEFFRWDEGQMPGINPDYWSEKLQAIDKRGGFEEYTTDKFNETIKNYFDNYWEFDDEETKKNSWEAIEEYVLGCETEESAHNTAYTYSCPITQQEFVDFWESNLKEYTYHYLYCCYAIPWAIKLYDEKKENDKQQVGL